MSSCHTGLILAIATLCHTRCYLCLLSFPYSNFRYFPPRYGAPAGCGRRNGLQIWRVAANILNKQSRTADKGWSPNFVDGRGITQNFNMLRNFHKTSALGETGGVIQGFGGGGHLKETDHLEDLGVDGKIFKK